MKRKPKRRELQVDHAREAMLAQRIDNVERALAVRIVEHDMLKERHRACLDLLRTLINQELAHE